MGLGAWSLCTLVLQEQELAVGMAFALSLALLPSLRVCQLLCTMCSRNH